MVSKRELENEIINRMAELNTTRGVVKEYEMALEDLARLFGFHETYRKRYRYPESCVPHDEPHLFFSPRHLVRDLETIRRAGASTEARKRLGLDKEDDND